jgi:hypothetical protein
MTRIFANSRSEKMLKPKDCRLLFHLFAIIREISG